MQAEVKHEGVKVGEMIVVQYIRIANISKTDNMLIYAVFRGRLKPNRAGQAYLVISEAENILGRMHRRKFEIYLDSPMAIDPGEYIEGKLGFFVSNQEIEMLGLPKDEEYFIGTALFHAFAKQKNDLNDMVLELHDEISGQYTTVTLTDYPPQRFRHLAPKGRSTRRV